MSKLRVGVSWPVLVSLVCCGVWGCSTPDPEGRLDEFSAATADRRGVQDNNTPTGARKDFSGTYFLAASTVIGVNQPLYLRATVVVSEDLGTIDFVFQPLTVDTDAEPRTPVGPEIVVSGVPYGEDGRFEADLGTVTVDGRANPLTGREIVADLVLLGTACGGGVFCGSVDGRVTAPIESPLAGSTFGAVESADFVAAEVVASCPDSCGAATNNPPNNVNNPPNNVNNPPNNVNNPMPEVRGRCVEGLAGTYTLFFLTDTQRDQGSAPTELSVELTASDNPAICVSGRLISKTTGDDLGGVESVALVPGGQLSWMIKGFVIPPGANPLLPNGGKANVELRGLNWSEDGSCGEMTFTLVEPFMLASEGTFGMLRDGDADRTLAGPSCAEITRGTPCGSEELAGRYRLKFLTDTQRDQGSPPTDLIMNLEPSGLTCLGGTIESLLEAGTILTQVRDGVPGEGDTVVVRVPNFGIPAGANPLLPNGGQADFTLTATLVEESSFCGDLSFALFDPFPLTSAGTFAAGLEGVAEPTEPACAE